MEPVLGRGLVPAFDYSNSEGLNWRARRSASHPRWLAWPRALPWRLFRAHDSRPHADRDKPALDLQGVAKLRLDSGCPPGQPKYSPPGLPNRAPAQAVPSDWRLRQVPQRDANSLTGYAPTGFPAAPAAQLLADDCDHIVHKLRPIIWRQWFRRLCMRSPSSFATPNSVATG